MFIVFKLNDLDIKRKSNLNSKSTIKTIATRKKSSNASFTQNILSKELTFTKENQKT